MSILVPELSRAAVRQSVEKLKSHTRTLLAIFGTGEPDSIPVEGKGTVEVVPVRSELELRSKLPALGETACRAYLVPFNGPLPDDIAGRFVRNGTVERIGPIQQLASLTGAADATVEAANARLAGYLLRRDNPTKLYPTNSQTLTPQGLMEVWLRTDWGLPIEEGLGADTLLGFAVRDARGGLFVEAMRAPAAQGVEDELAAFLEERLGALGPLIWDAWKHGRGPALAGFAVLAEVLSQREDSGVGYWLRPKLKEIAVVSTSTDARLLIQALGRLARPTLAWLRRRDEASVARVLSDAERLDDAPTIRAQLIESPRLPSAWQLRLEALGSALVDLAKTPERPQLDKAERAWKELEKHEFFLHKERALDVQRAEMTLRLAGWLVTRPDRALGGAPTTYGDVETLGAWYAQEGGFVDRARRAVRGIQSGPLAKGATVVVQAADAARTELDRRFSKALEAWIHAGRPSKNVLPIDSALERVAARFLSQSEDRSLLVLLMDGMAWAQAIELLPSLGESGRCWGPIAWSQMGANRIGASPYPVMIAALPTVTEVSRAAFFAGKCMKNGAQLATSRDPDHFADNKQMQAFCETTLKPRLLLRGEGHTADGSLSPEAERLIKETRERRVVALVVNAIDASLKGDSQQEHRWDVDSIRSLPQIFEAAHEAGRHILMVADHGHVPADRLKTIGAGRGGGARWRVWDGAGDVLVEGERKFSGDGVYVPKGAEGVVLLEDDGARYGGGAHAGEHGGSALAEVVAPCVLLGWSDELRTQQDQALEVRSLYIPDWWTRSLPSELEAKLERDEPAPKAKKAKPTSERQIGLPGIAPVEPPKAETVEPPASQRSPSVQPKPAELLPAFYASEMLKARTANADERKHVVQAVHFLITRSGVAPASAFAAHLGVPGFRVGGLVSKLQEVLNLDGYEVLSFDRTNQQISLQKSKLEQQFEVKL